MGNSNLLPYETIVRATSGEPEAVDEVLRHYSKQIPNRRHWKRAYRQGYGGQHKTAACCSLV